jgi:hypothetical protein
MRISADITSNVQEIICWNSNLFKFPPPPPSVRRVPPPPPFQISTWPEIGLTTGLILVIWKELLLQAAQLINKSLLSDELDQEIFRDRS